ncbi:proteasome subunit alpha type-2 [Trichomonascus vanleenenianus]|uniref:proteasome core particle subunit alpha 2 n=1 Tax=Trichomonascus vanleenenianus TaxID=2268995 RepID=UPI003ECAF331
MADRYSFSLTTFSPSGKLVQIEYALQAVNQGVTALGIKASNGIVLATEKKASSHLIDADALEKVASVTPDIGMVYSGMGPDFRVLLDSARRSSHVGYKRKYKEYPPTKILVQQVARTVQEATQSGGVRPYGVSLLVAGHDDSHGYNLYQVDPSGSYFAWKATAIGKNSASAKTFLEKRWNKELELEDAIHIALLTLKETIESEMNGNTVEIAVIGNPNDHLKGYEGHEDLRGPRFRKLSAQEIDDRLDAL